jgi:hypothetical protein
MSLLLAIALGKPRAIAVSSGIGEYFCVLQNLSQEGCLKNVQFFVAKRRELSSNSYFIHLKLLNVMANQVVKAYFSPKIVAGLTWSLYDASGVQSTGTTTTTDCLVMTVPYGMSIDHEYRLIFRDANGLQINQEFSHADGGIVIVDNVDIHRNPLTAKTMSTSVKSKR